MVERAVRWRNERGAVRWQPMTESGQKAWFAGGGGPLWADYSPSFPKLTRFKWRAERIALAKERRLSRKNWYPEDE